MTTDTDQLKRLLAAFPEINPLNFNWEDVKALNEWGIEVHNAAPALIEEVEGLRAWRDEAVAACARRQCSLRDRRITEAEADNAALRARLEKVEARCLNLDFLARELLELCERNLATAFPVVVKAHRADYAALAPTEEKPR